MRTVLLVLFCLILFVPWRCSLLVITPRLLGSRKFFSWKTFCTSSVLSLVCSERHVLCFRTIRTSLSAECSVLGGSWGTSGCHNPFCSLCHNLQLWWVLLYPVLMHNSADVFSVVWLFVVPWVVVVGHRAAELTAPTWGEQSGGTDHAAMAPSVIPVAPALPN